MVSYKARFTNVNDPYSRYLIVCVDKTWDQPGCQPWTGDWVTTDPMVGQSVDSPYFTPTTVLTAVTSSDAGYYYRVDIIDENGNVVYTCDHVDRHTPCYFYPSTSTTTTVSSVTLPGVSPTVSPTIPATTPTCPAVGYYGVISAQPVTSVWTVGQPLQIVLNMCSPSSPSSNVPIDVSATALVCNKEFSLGDLGHLATYPANQSQATITITIPPLLTPNMCPPGRYTGILRLGLTFEDPRGTSSILYAVLVTFDFPSTTTTVSVPTMPAPTTSPLVVAPTPTPVTPTPTSKTAMYIAIGAVAIIALAGFGYWLYSRRKK